MKFMVIARATATPPAGLDRVGLLVETQRQLSTAAEVVEVYSFAGERAFAMVIEATTAADLNHLVFALAGEALMDFESHALVE